MTARARKQDENAAPTRLFQNGNSQAVRIPKELAYESVETEVEILRRGDELIVRPVRRKLAHLGEDLRRLGRMLNLEQFERQEFDETERDWSGFAVRPRKK
jgi:antitoxin VapB